MVSKLIAIVLLLCVASVGIFFGLGSAVTGAAIVSLWAGAGLFWLGLGLSRSLTCLMNKRREAAAAYAEDGSDASSGTLYVGNLDYTVTEDDVRNFFKQYGQVISVRMMRDRRTDRFRGFGFVEMSYEDALKAMDAVAGKDFMGRKLKVNLANDKRR